MKHPARWLQGVIVGVAIALLSGPAIAQTSEPTTVLSQTNQGLSCVTAAGTDPKKLIQLDRARNLARQAAERVNGGLSVYRAEPALHSPARELRPDICWMETPASRVFTFTLYGYPVAQFDQYDPIAREMPKQLPIQTVVIVDATGDWTATVLENTYLSKTTLP